MAHSIAWYSWSGLRFVAEKPSNYASSIAGKFGKRVHISASATSYEGNAWRPSQGNTISRREPSTWSRNSSDTPTSSTNDTARKEWPDRLSFRSVGSKSAPSKPSYPARFSKYSTGKKNFKDPIKPSKEITSWADFKDTNSVAPSDVEADDSRQLPPTSKESDIPEPPSSTPTGSPEIAPVDFPFEYQYSYSEQPKVKPIGYRGPKVSPFGPTTMSRPWTGGPPLKKSSSDKLPKLLLEFDTFIAPPRKKDVKLAQPSGPHEEGERPKYTRSRAEIIGSPLTAEETRELIEECNKDNRQVNLGRDGLTHNMLEVIHSHWKRRRICKLRCKGVPTVDMDNVQRAVEEKTGGVVLKRSGGSLYVFRGRNYNYMLRPKLPIMLWKPPAPIYPRLIQDIPPGLTKQEAYDFRRSGRKIKPLCKLSKNGVYLTLVADVQEAFKCGDILVRIDCQGLCPSDYKKIGAKLRDLVPCVLLSFEKEQILMWRGREWPTPGSSDRDTHAGDSLVIKDSEITEEREVPPQRPSGLLYVEDLEGRFGDCGQPRGDPDLEVVDVVTPSSNEPESHARIVSSLESTEGVGLPEKPVESAEQDVSEYEGDNGEQLYKFDLLWDQALGSGEAVSYDAQLGSLPDEYSSR